MLLSIPVFQTGLTYHMYPTYNGIRVAHVRLFLTIISFCAMVTGILGVKSCYITLLTLVECVYIDIERDKAFLLVKVANKLLLCMKKNTCTYAF